MIFNWIADKTQNFATGEANVPANLFAATTECTIITDFYYSRSFVQIKEKDNKVHSAH